MRTGSPILGILLGLVLLGGVVAFTLGLEDGGGEASGAELPPEPFPSELREGSLVTADRIGAIDGINVSPEQLASALEEQAAYAETRLAEVFEHDAAVTTYVAPDLSAQAQVTAYAGEPGLFKPGLPADPEAQHPGSWFEATRFGDVRCFAAWASDARAGATGIPAAVQCQRGESGRTFDIRTSGLAVEDTVAALNEVVAHAQGQ